MDTVIYSVDENESYSFTFDDLITFHGKKSIIGVAIAFKALQLLQERMLPETFIMRKQFFFETSFEDQGFLDVIEVVSRAYSNDLYNISTTPYYYDDTGLKKDSLFFKATQDNSFCLFTMKDEILSSHDSKEKIASEILSKDFFNIFHIIDISPSKERKQRKNFYTQKSGVPITVIDNDTPIIISYSQLISYHGIKEIYGVTLMYKLFLEAYNRCFLIYRGKTDMILGTVGDGILDTVEFILRPSAYNKKIILDKEFGGRYKDALALGGAANGGFIFKLENPHQSLLLSLKKEFYPTEYIKLICIEKEIDFKKQFSFVKSLLEASSIFNIK